MDSPSERSSGKDFEVLGRIGSGSFGTVYKVRRIHDNIIYVIKNVRIAELPKKQQSDAINEVSLLAKLDSDYVVKYFDSFIENNSLQIVMEFCNKGDLQRMISKAKTQGLSNLGERAIWNITLQIMLGLYDIHRMKILHRDLKSANVFLTKPSADSRYQVKIGDLGVAKLLESSTAFANTIVGTPYYISPELCADLPYRDKSDVWALGVIIYECCTLDHPFDASNQFALVMKIVQSPVHIPESLPDDLQQLIGWLLQKDPKNRPTMKQLLCEKTVRHKFEEYAFELPADLLECDVVSFITSDAGSAVPTGKTEKVFQDFSVSPQVKSVRQRDAQSKEVANARSRVRGRMEARKVARLRYQVQPPEPKPIARPANEEKSYVDALLGDKPSTPALAIPTNEVKSQHKYEEMTSYDDEDFEEYVSDDDAAESKEYRDVRSQSKLPDVDDSKHSDEDGQEEEGYEYDDGEELLDNDRNDEVEHDDVGLSQQVAPSWSVKSLHKSMKLDELLRQEEKEHACESDGDDVPLELQQTIKTSVPLNSIRTTSDGGDVELEGGLWESMWSCNRGIINDLADNNTNDREATASRRVQMLRGLVEDSRRIAVAQLGEHVFNRVYQLLGMLSNAQRTNEDSRNKSAEKRHIKELEKTIRETLNCGIHEACSVVFEMKKLLTIESHLFTMQQEQCRKEFNDEGWERSSPNQT